MTPTIEPTPLQLAEAQAKKDRALLEKLQARQASLKEAGDPVASELDGIISEIQSVVLKPNRAQRRHRAVNPKMSSSTVARARRKIRARIEKRSRARNRA